MWFECEQPFLSGEPCVTSRKTAAKETRADSARSHHCALKQPMIVFEQAVCPDRIP